MSKNKIIFILQGTNRAIIFFMTALSVRATLPSIHSSQPLGYSLCRALQGLSGLAAAAAKDKTLNYKRMLFLAGDGQRFPGKAFSLTPSIPPTPSFNP